MYSPELSRDMYVFFFSSRRRHTRLVDLAREANICLDGPSSDPHRHHDVAVLIILALGGTQLAGGLGVLQFQPYVAGAGSLEEVDDILSVEADGQRLAVVVGLNRVFGFARL